jgi:hypothetical protein
VTKCGKNVRGGSVSIPGGVSEASRGGAPPRVCSNTKVGTKSLYCYIVWYIRGLVQRAASPNNRGDKSGALFAITVAVRGFDIRYVVKPSAMDWHDMIYDERLGVEVVRIPKDWLSANVTGGLRPRDHCAEPFRPSRAALVRHLITPRLACVHP